MVERNTQIPELTLAISEIDGQELESRINKLAAIGEDGCVGEGGSRLAFRPVERESRAFVKDLFLQAGFDEIQEHVGGLVGVYKGQEPDLPAVGFGSHFDTVPRAGKYDGPFGTVAAINVVEVFHKAGIRPKRNLVVIAFTAEEASRFNSALIGSRAMFRGLPEEVLEMKREGDIPLGEAVKALGFDPETLKTPVFRKEDLHCWIETHIEQGERMAKSALDVAVVDSIASPDRQRIEIGISLEHTKIPGKEVRGLRVVVNGKGGHSGGTPMGRENRADGLRPVADLLMAAAALHEAKLKALGVSLYVGGVEIDGGALNKIPALTTTDIFLSANDHQSLIESSDLLKTYLEKLNKLYGGSKNPQFVDAPVSFQNICITNPGELHLFDPTAVLPYFKTAARTIAAIEQIAQKYSELKVVGTVGTFNLTSDGTIRLGMDVRGVNLESRNMAIEEILAKLEQIGKRESVEVTSQQMQGSSEPTVLDEELVNITEQTARDLGMRVGRLYSAAGHDTQNVAAIGIPSVMIFIPSRNGGISHDPTEYSTPQDLENGAKVLAATVYRLAN